MSHTPTRGATSGEAPFAHLSPAARTAWAKHDRRTDGWMPLWRHMADSASVAGQLWDEWVPGNVKSLVAESLPGGNDDARRLVVFLAAAHDAGKATCAFACQVESLADCMRAAGLDMLSAKEYGTDRRMAPHGLAGQLLLQEWLSERHGMSARASGQFAVVAGGHHGTPPEHQQIHDLQLRPRLLRHPGASEAVWRHVQYELMDGCAELAQVVGRLPAWQSVRLPQTVQVLLTAIVILSDWIASAPELFPYDPASWQPSGSVGEARRLRAAWQGLDLPGPWLPTEPDRSAKALFAERFDLPAGAEVRPVQAEAVRMARLMPASGLLMIEAPMGEGKTEAAFAAAEILAARTGAGGCLVALPTRATGDAMFPRLLDWLGRLPLDGPRSVVLAHAKSALNDLWAGMMRSGHRAIAAVELDRPDRVGEVRAARSEPAGLHAHQWLRGRKKSLLASFAVGTIDQVLFAGLKSRHLALRHLAVAGKVVIIDEVHAYDAYMSRYLDRVLEWLAAYRVPVVLLSATLPAARRQALAAAYSGSGTALDVPDNAYPLITAVAPGLPTRTTEPAAASDRRTEVSLERLDDDLALLADRLQTELSGGGCALVVRNTVDRVLEAADALRERFGDDAVTVAHSRFLAADRAANDVKLRERFGPGGDRPAGPHVVVASQVVEQSLDVDFDLLVTDLAPVDLLLQRMGRLHRHPRTRPRRLSTARCLVTGVNWQAEPPLPARGSRAIYPPYTLLRALAVLGPHMDGAALVLPEHISPLVQAAYGEGDVGPVSWSEEMSTARADHLRLLAEKQEKAEAFLLAPVRRAGRPVYGWLGANAGDVDDSRTGRAQVRDGEESLEVLVVQRRRDGGLTTVPWLGDGRGGLELPTDFPPSRRAAEAVAASAITLPWQFSKPWVIDRTIDELERFVVRAWQVKECPWLAGELMLVLDEDCQTPLGGFVLRYSSADGLRVSSADASAPSPAVSEGGLDPGEDDDVDHEKVAGSPASHGSSALTVPCRRAPESDDPEEVSSLASRDLSTPPLSSSFDLTTSPWLPVQWLDGRTEELSLRDVFAHAHDVRRLVGDVPTQEFALLRLLLAILYDALDGPAELEDWSELWQSRDPFGAVPGYLDTHRHRFDLLHPDDPFFQVADLCTEKNEVASLNRIVADVPNGDPFFAMRHPGVERLTYAEAARWLVHTHAYDSSGIKSGMAGDTRAKAGKVYPLGVGSAGNLGGVFAEGTNLRETLLLNLIPLAEGIVDGASGEGAEDSDLPAWKRPSPGPGQMEEAGHTHRPTGLRDLYTWQSRRVRLHAENGEVTGVVLGYGDPLALSAPWKLEPMSTWRRSAAQEKKRGRSPVYMPQQHDPSRAAWRGLASLLPARRSATDDSGSGEAPRSLPSGVVNWYSMLTTEGELDPLSLLRVRIVGAVYGTQQSVVDEIVDDAVVFPVVLLHQEHPAYGATAVDAMTDAENAVRALGQLAGNLARATGADPAPPTATARDLGFGELDGPYRKWLTGLATHSDLEAARQQWQTQVRHRTVRLSRGLLDSAGPAASEGRVVDAPEGSRLWINDARADLWFRWRLNRVLPLAARASEGPGPAEPRTNAPGPVPLPAQAPASLTTQEPISHDDDQMGAAV
ncbi:type I-E CRISPR-associated protein Cse1/CasA [Streptomyces sp. ISL-11]|uniref:type I-E CRISPR-associated protein Cse1/CasA n=1 Tax=Streptomyces sp. ISL-11 TaxID=2819174 RepID=UPI001BEC7DC9|nr:type I-E CRISPR-associated protein Cse1/CasA [Streptomyces sp. ISL-11]MBT2384071.1 type I-E CRISPR-associated protein Cse1/CasA [Streptomyces sp. ISL-11]